MSTDKENKGNPGGGNIEKGIDVNIPSTRGNENTGGAGAHGGNTALEEGSGTPIRPSKKN